MSETELCGMLFGDSKLDVDVKYLISLCGISFEGEL
jgi:hypothetical protein